MHPDKVCTRSSWLAAGKTVVDQTDLEKYKKMVFNDVLGKSSVQRGEVKEGPEGNQTSTYRGKASEGRVQGPQLNTDHRGRFPHTQH